MAISCQGAHGPQESRRRGVRWSGASPLRPRPVEALRLARGLHVAHATIHRWVSQDSPPRAAGLAQVAPG